MSELKPNGKEMPPLDSQPPEALLYFCATDDCREETSHQPSRIFWVPSLNDWYCEDCMSYHDSPETGIRLSEWLEIPRPANKLSRLKALNAELVEALELVRPRVVQADVASATNYWVESCDKVIAALAKAKGETE